MDLFIIFNIGGLFLAQWGNQTTRVFSYNTCWVNIMVCFVQWLPLHSFLITILMSRIVPSEQATGLSLLKRAARLAAFSYYSCGEKQSQHCKPISITSDWLCCGWNGSKHSHWHSFEVDKKHYQLCLIIDSYSLDWCFVIGIKSGPFCSLLWPWTPC